MIDHLRPPSKLRVVIICCFSLRHGSDAADAHSQRQLLPVCGGEAAGDHLRDHAAQVAAQAAAGGAAARAGAVPQRLQRGQALRRVPVGIHHLQPHGRPAPAL